MKSNNRKSAGSAIHHRRHGRILAMQTLCQLDVQGDEYLESVEGFLAESSMAGKVQRYADGIVRPCWSKRADLDARLNAVMAHWTLERISPVERNILRVALTELDAGEVPAKVVINEAVEIGREYGGAESPAFINGVLDAAWKQMQASDEGEPDR